ncbi:MAG: hypothetical protein EBY40_00260, partial [Marivivens sp.]|nr:hypothetical protein [Marivivens sp.]
TRPLGTTGLEVPILAFGASSLGQEFRRVTLEEALGSVRTALDCGLRLIDTSPFYGRGMSEVLLGLALRDIPRDDYLLCTKLGRYDLSHFDFSARRVAESIDVSVVADASFRAKTVSLVGADTRIALDSLAYTEAFRDMVAKTGAEVTQENLAIAYAFLRAERRAGRLERVY